MEETGEAAISSDLQTPPKCSATEILAPKPDKATRTDIFPDIDHILSRTDEKRIRRFPEPALKETKDRERQPTKSGTAIPDNRHIEAHLPTDKNLSPRTKPPVNDRPPYRYRRANRTKRIPRRRNIRLVSGTKPHKKSEKNRPAFRSYRPFRILFPGSQLLRPESYGLYRRTQVRRPSFPNTP